MCRDIKCDCNHREYKNIFGIYLSNIEKKKAAITEVLCGFLADGCSPRSNAAA